MVGVVRGADRGWRLAPSNNMSTPRGSKREKLLIPATFTSSFFMVADIERGVEKSECPFTTTS